MPVLFNQNSSSGGGSSAQYLYVGGYLNNQTVTGLTLVNPNSTSINTGFNVSSLGITIINAGRYELTFRAKFSLSELIAKLGIIVYKNGIPIASADAFINNSSGANVLQTINTNAVFNANANDLIELKANATDALGANINVTILGDGMHEQALLVIKSI